MRGSKLAVFGWHNVHPTWCFPRVREKSLEAQLTFLGRFTNVVPLDQALRDLAAGRSLPSRAVAITFDDGYTDNLEVAGPMLRRLGLPATCFLVPGILNGDVTPWWERCAWVFAKATRTTVTWKGEAIDLGEAEAKRAVFKRIAEELKLVDRTAREAAIDDLQAQLEPTGECAPGAPFLDWDGAKRLQEYFTIGSHTMNHSILSQETPEAQAEDLAESRRQLVSRLGSDIAVLAYPNGRAVDYDEHTISAAEKAGYEFSITTRHGFTKPDTPPHEVRRWVMNPARGAVDFGRIVKYALTNSGR